MTGPILAGILTLLVVLVAVLSLPFLRGRPVLIAEDHTEDPEDKPTPLAATYDLLAEMMANGAPMEDVDGVLDTVIALSKERVA